MLEATLTQLEQLVSDLLQQNQAHSESISRLEQELHQIKDENDSLQLAAMEQDEKVSETLVRLKALVERGGRDSQA